MFRDARRGDSLRFGASHCIDNQENRCLNSFFNGKKNLLFCFYDDHLEYLSKSICYYVISMDLIDY